MTLPNFHALRDWIEEQLGGRPLTKEKLDNWVTKLENWCKEAQDEREKLRSRVSDLEHEITDLKDESAHLESLEGFLDDVERGIRTLDERETVVPSYERS